MLIATIAAAVLPFCAIASAIGPRQANRIAVNVNRKYQTTDGFGFSEAFQRAYNIYNLPEPKRTEVLDLLFNKTTGPGFTILRNGIGSSPSSQNDWMNTILPVSPGKPTGPPKYYVWDGKDSGRFWVSQQAVKYGVKTFYGNAWSTAWCSWGGSGDSYTWANNIYTGLTTGNVSAYLWWVGTQDRATNNNNNEKLILVERDSYQVSKRLWAFAQYSRTVRPGAVRVDASGGNSLRTTAFLNTDGTLAVNVINAGASAASGSIAGTNGTSAQAWVTDNTHDMDLTTASIAGDGTITGSVPGRAIVSFVIS
ncbi:hypothetical protein DL765_001576 [Monosporascus sp. GIB2]|nr:hypothetical protein DL765_001576 [Monosporascus sp. GIB2]